MAKEHESKASIRVDDKNIVVELLDPRLRRVALTIGWMLILAGGLAALYLAWPFIDMVIRTALPFVVGLVFAYVFDPIVTFVQRRLRLSRIGGVLVLYLIFIAAITVFFAILLPILITQIKGAYHGIADFIADQIQRLSGMLAPATDAEGNPVEGGGIVLLWQQLQEWLVARGIIIEDLFQQAARNEGVREAAKGAATSGVRVVGDAITFFLSVVLSLVGSVTFLIFAILVNIYLLLDFSKMRDVLEVLTPDQYEDRMFGILGKIDTAVGGFIRGMMIDAFLVGLLTFIGLWILGLKQYALLIGVIAGIGTFIPYMGAISGALPALLYVAFSDAYHSVQERLFYAGGVIVLTVIIQTLEGFVFQPKIVGKAAQLHPIAVLFALAFGVNFGLLGMILAVPVACIVRVLWKEFFWDRTEAEWKRTTGKRFLGDWRRKGKRQQKAEG